MLKITTLIENKLDKDTSLNWEHGLSLFIEVDGKKILFDTGQSGEFTKNAEKLGIDLGDLDYVVISHAHYDHSGGFEKLVEEYGSSFNLILGRGFFKEKHSLSGDIYRYVGSAFQEEFLREKNIETYYVEGLEYITENTMIITDFNREPEYENINETMFIKENGNYSLDRFTDEIAIAIDTEKGLVVLVGCSHPGIVNMLDTIIKRTGKEIYHLIGGTHLMKEGDTKINKVIAYLKDKKVKKVSACHCSGRQAETMMSQQMKNEFQYNSTGDIIEIEG